MAIVKSSRSLRSLFTQIASAIHRLRQLAPHKRLTLAPLEESTPQAVTTVQWPLDHASSHKSDGMHKVVVVDVDYFAKATHVADLRRCREPLASQNYTIDGEDPNQRITNYPPSDRLH